LAINQLITRLEYKEGDEIIIISRANIAQQWAQEAQKEQKKAQELPPQY
jgi:hypothetical protein